MAELADVLRRHRRVGFDTAAFIYLFESSPRYAGAAGEALSALERGEFAGVTSVLTVMEIIVKPLRESRPAVAREYELLIRNFPHLHVVDINGDIARRAASLRASDRLRPADALQLAACLQVGASAFLTNDKQLRRVSHLDIVLLDEYV